MDRLGWARSILLVALLSSTMLGAVSAFANSTVALGVILVAAGVVNALAVPAAFNTPAVHEKPLLLLAIAGGIGAAVVAILSAFFVSSAVETGVGSTNGAGLLLVAGGVLGIVARVLTGWLEDRTANPLSSRWSLVCSQSPQSASSSSESLHSGLAGGLGTRVCRRMGVVCAVLSGSGTHPTIRPGGRDRNRADRPGNRGSSRSSGFRYFGRNGLVDGRLGRHSRVLAPRGGRGLCRGP